MIKQLQLYKTMLTLVGIAGVIYSAYSEEWNTFIYLSVASVILNLAEWLSKMAARSTFLHRKIYSYVYLVLCTIVFLYAARPVMLNAHNEEAYQIFSSVISDSLALVLLGIVKIAITYVCYSYLILMVKSFDTGIGKVASKVHTYAFALSTMLFLLPLFIITTFFYQSIIGNNLNISRGVLICSLLIAIPLFFFIPYKVMRNVNKLLVEQ